MANAMHLYLMTPGVFDIIINVQETTSGFQSESVQWKKKSKLADLFFAHLYIFYGKRFASIWDLFSQNERQVARDLKEIWLTEHFKNQ